MHVVTCKMCKCKRTSCHTGYIVSYADSGESDDHKVDGFQSGPSLDVFKYDGRDGDEDYAAGQDEEDGGRHSDLSLADLFVFLLQNTQREMEAVMESGL